MSTTGHNFKTPSLTGRQPDFERLRTAIKRQEPDCVPFADLIVEEDVRAAFLGRPIRGFADDIEFWACAGYDYLPVALSIIKPGRAMAGTAMSSYSVYARQYTERTWADMHTGTIVSCEQCAAYPWPDVDAMHVEVLDELAQILPQGMKVLIQLGKIFTANWLFQGAETFYLNVYDNPELIEMMYDKIGPLVYATFERVIEHPVVGAVMHPDDLAGTSGLLLDADHFRRHVFPWYKKMGKICRQLDKPMIFHSDGDIWTVMDDVVDAGFEAIHPIDPNAMDINEVMTRYGDRLALIGNIDVQLLARGTPDDIDGLVKQRISDLAPGGGYVLGSGNSVPEFVPIENYLAMLRAGARYGKYPINGP